MFIEKIILYAPLNYRRFALYVAKKLPPPRFLGVHKHKALGYSNYLHYCQLTGLDSFLSVS